MGRSLQILQDPYSYLLLFFFIRRVYTVIKGDSCLISHCWNSCGQMFVRWFDVFHHFFVLQNQVTYHICWMS